MTKFYSSDEAEYKIDKTEFEFVQLKEDIADETFQDKAIGFFKDAMMRFCRSKVSIIAFVAYNWNYRYFMYGNRYAND